ncbi:MAG: hypothetical protein ABMA15_14435 [Vicinamibacterales bacterium]
MRQVGLAVDAMPDLPKFLEDAEELLRNFERDAGTLPAIPEKLLKDARALGRDV